MKTMLSLPRNRTAALFIDLQEEHRRDPRYLVESYDKVLENAAAVLTGLRRNAAPVFHFAYLVDPASPALPPFHPLLPDGRSAFSDKDDPLCAICGEVAPDGNEQLIVKSEASAFGSGFGRALRALDIEWLVVAGVWTEACVAATVKDALTQGFRVLLVKDACGSGTMAMHQTGVLNIANRLYGGAVVDTRGALKLMAGEALDVWRTEGAVPIRFTFENASALYGQL